MPPVPDFQHVLLRKATQDLRAAETLASFDSLHAEAIGFHCQQAIEKAMKAVLESRGVRYPLSHDLVVLIAMLAPDPQGCPVSVEDALSLNPFAVRFRYDDLPERDDPEEPFDRAEAVRLASIAVAWASALIDPQTKADEPEKPAPKG